MYFEDTNKNHYRKIQ